MSLPKRHHGDLLAEAQQLLSLGFIPAAGAIARSALERILEDVPGAFVYDKAAVLCRRGLIDDGTKQLIRYAWKIGGQAVHGDHAERKDIEHMIALVERLRRILSS